MTRVRWEVALLLFCVTNLNYGNRTALAIAGPVAAESLGFSPLLLGQIFAAFSLAYVLGQLPGGWLLDRFGSRRVYLASIVLWSLFTLLQGAAALCSGMAAFFVLSGLCFMVGLAAAPSFPGNSRMGATWFAVGERATAVTGINSAQYFAPALFSPLLALCVEKLSWPTAFVIMGLLGFVAALWWWRTVHPPVEHPRVSEAELEHMRGGGALVTLDSKQCPAGSTTAGAGGSAWKALGFLLRSRDMVGLYVGQYCLSAINAFFISWYPMYLVGAWKQDLVSAGLWTVLPAVCGGMGSLAGGMTSDWIMRRSGSLTLARKVPIILGLCVAMGIGVCVWLESVTAVGICMSVALFGKGFGTLGWTVLADTAPRGMTGFAGGVFNMFGNLSGVVTPIAIGVVLQLTSSYDFALLLVAAHAAVGALCFAVVMQRVERLKFS